MKSLFTTMVTLMVVITLNAQKISKVTLKNDGNIESFSINIDNGVTIIMGKDGAITEWGTETFSERNQSYSRLDKYLGRVEYFTANDNEAFRGKVKYIGMTAITYYGTYDKEEFRGKVRSIGTTIFDYYTFVEDESLKGLSLIHI